MPQISAAMLPQKHFRLLRSQTIRDIDEVREAEAPGGQKPGFPQDLDEGVLVQCEPLAYLGDYQRGSAH
jgi:hypothetical protein